MEVLLLGGLAFAGMKLNQEKKYQISNKKHKEKSPNIYHTTNIKNVEKEEKKRASGKNKQSRKSIKHMTAFKEHRILFKESRALV